MDSLTFYLQERLKLEVNAEKSAVGRPWKRKFLGYSMTSHKRPRLKVSSASLARLRDKLREQFRQGRGRNLARFIKPLTPMLMRMGELFSSCRGERQFRETGRLDMAQTALYNVATMETVLRPLQKPDEMRDSERARLAIGRE